MNKGKGLGRGIDALFQDIAKLEDVDVKNEQVTEILLNELRPNPYRPRKTFDETSLQELANSILHSGVFQPIIVRKSAVKGYEIIAGERRFRASKLAGKEKIPAIIRELLTVQRIKSSSIVSPLISKTAFIGRIFLSVSNPFAR